LFIEAWQPWPFDFFVLVFDNEDDNVAAHELLSATVHDGRYRVLTPEHVQGLGADGECISVGDPGIKMLGLWFASAVLRHENVIILDDDCYPFEGDVLQFAEGHLKNLHAYPKWKSPIEPYHIRGLPYFHHHEEPQLENVVASVGLWHNVPDFDSVHSLARTREREQISGFCAKHVETSLLHPQQLMPLCGMNFALRSSVAAACYFPKMGKGSPFYRFDDIWGGFILQRVCRHLGLAIAYGNPCIEHIRASRPMDNLVREAQGIFANEVLWKLIDSIYLSPDIKSVNQAVFEIGNQLKSPVSTASLPKGELYDPLRAYIPQLGKYLHQWLNLMRRDHL
jgi:hypothetical protein